ncbi:MAG: SRPBCC domain-containing protein [Devosia sp.]
MAETHDLTLTRQIAAPIRRVWEAWTDPKHLRRWFFPDHCPLVESDFDVREGGKYRCVMRGESGKDHTMVGEFKTVDPKGTLVFTHEWVGEHMPHTGHVTRVTVTLAERHGGTFVTMRQEGLLAADVRDSHADGWGMFLDHLVAFAPKMKEMAGA